MDYSKISNVEFEGVDHSDYPDYSDAFCVYGEIDGEIMTDEQLDEFNDSDARYEFLIDSLI